MFWYTRIMVEGGRLNLIKYELSKDNYFWKHEIWNGTKVTCIAPICVKKMHIDPIVKPLYMTIYGHNQDIFPEHLWFLALGTVEWVKEIVLTLKVQGSNDIINSDRYSGRVAGSRTEKNQ